MSGCFVRVLDGYDVLVLNAPVVLYFSVSSRSFILFSSVAYKRCKQHVFMTSSVFLTVTVLLTILLPCCQLTVFIAFLAGKNYQL